MKAATTPSVGAEPECRAEVEVVLADGETLDEFVEAAVCIGVELAGLHRSLDATRAQPAKKGK